MLRCLIADIPQKVLADIVQTVTQQDENIEVIGQLPDLTGLKEFLDKQRIDVLIVGMQKNTPHSLCQNLLKNFPDLLIVGLIDDGRMAMICLGDVGSHQLIDIIVSMSHWGNASVVANGETGKRWS